MNKEQYMKMLKRYLRHLPKAEFNRAIEYYEEYFAEAGAEHETQAIADLGTPSEAADTIIQNFAIENARTPVGTVKKGISAAWVGVLAVCAAPVTLPVFLMALMVVMLVLIVAIVVIVVFLALGVSVVISAPVTILAGIMTLPQNPPAALICVGYGLCGIGLGLLVVYAIGILGTRFLNGMVRLFGRMVKRGGGKHA